MKRKETTMIKQQPINQDSAMFYAIRIFIQEQDKGNYPYFVISSKTRCLDIRTLRTGNKPKWSTTISHWNQQCREYGNIELVIGGQKLPTRLIELSHQIDF